MAFAETGDPGLDFALGFLGKLGIGPELPEMQAVSLLSIIEAYR